MTHQHTVSGTLYEIEVSENRKQVTIWSQGNHDTSPVSHFGAESTETEEEIVSQVEDWLTQTWGER